MNKKQSQSGSAHLIIIIVLAVALLGSLGYVFYLNFMQPKSTPAPTPAVVVTPAPTPAVTDSYAGYLVIDDWNIKLKLPDGISAGTTVEYQKVSGNGSFGDYYVLTTNKYRELGCPLNQYRLYRSDSALQDSSMSFAKLPIIDSMHFYYSGPQVPCVDGEYAKSHPETVAIESEYARVIPAAIETISKK